MCLWDIQMDICPRARRRKGEHDAVHKAVPRIIDVGFGDVLFEENIWIGNLIYNSRNRSKNKERREIADEDIED